jgi:hypothetical protein
MTAEHNVYTLDDFMRMAARTGDFRKDSEAPNMVTYRGYVSGIQDPVIFAFFDGRGLCEAMTKKTALEKRPQRPTPLPPPSQPRNSHKTSI